MTRWPTIQQYDAYMDEYHVKMRGENPDLDPEVPDEGPESVLQGKIVQYCKDHGLPCLSFPQTKKVRFFLTPGWPDMTIVIQGRVLFLELKAKHGIMSSDQGDMQLMMQALGAEYHKVKSYKRFLEIVNKKGG